MFRKIGGNIYKGFLYIVYYKFIVYNYFNILQVIINYRIKCFVKKRGIDMNYSQLKLDFEKLIKIVMIVLDRYEKCVYI